MREEALQQMGGGLPSGEQREWGHSGTLSRRILRKVWCKERESHQQGKREIEYLYSLKSYRRGKIPDGEKGDTYRK